MTSKKDHEFFMRAALKEAAKSRGKGNIATGAVIVRGGKIISRGHNEVHSTFDITADAETVAVRKLTIRARQLNPGSQADAGPFAGCTLYTTVEPCPMCFWVICISGLTTLVVGARHKKLGIPFGAYTLERFIRLTKRKIKVVDGILAEECAEMRRSGRFTPGPR